MKFSRHTIQHYHLKTIEVIINLFVYDGDIGPTS